MEALTFYFDQCFGKRLPQALEIIRPPFNVEHPWSKRNKFKQDMPDDAWLQVCGERSWVVLTHDDKFQDITVEAMAIRQHQVRAFALWGAQMPVWFKLSLLVKAYPKIKEIVSREKPPYLYRVKINGRITQVRLP